MIRLSNRNGEFTYFFICKVQKNKVMLNAKLIL